LRIRRTELLVIANPTEAGAILAAMRAVAEADGSAPLSDADRRTLVAAGTLGLGLEQVPDPDDISPATPGALADALGGTEAAAPDLAVFAIRFCSIMALVDGTLDDRKLEVVQAFADQLGVHADFVRELTETAHGHLKWALADMTRNNLLSITGKHWDIDDASGWLLPYSGDNEDPDLAARYRALTGLAPGTLGRAFSDWYTAHGFAFPGEPSALNEAFGTPHDSTHILSGYSTTPQGELLVSTFTAGMHPEESMEGNILPVIYSWHLGIEINTVAGSFTGVLDPRKFFVAWDRGAAVTGDFFTPGWDFWAVAPTPVEDLRSRMTVPDLDRADEASSDGTEGVDYHPIA
jgi:hypothetical protein